MRARLRVQGAAPRLIRDFTDRLGLPLTLTDAVGAVLASSGGRPLGQVDPVAIFAIREGEAMEHRTEGIRSQEEPGAVAGGLRLFPAEPGVYVPLQVEGRIEGVLIAHGEPDEVRVRARAAAAMMAVALGFAHGASISTRQNVAPDLVLRDLLRGAAGDVRRAEVVAKVLGWDLTVPRVAIVIRAARRRGHDVRALEPEHFEMVAEFVASVLPGTPFGQIEAAEWVLLPELPIAADRPPPTRVAEDVRAGLADAGAAVIVGLGEGHAERSLDALRRSYREAVQAARWGERLRGDNAVYELGDLGGAAFVAASPATRRRLAGRFVQRLRAHPDVLQSIRSFLESDLSLAATAQKTGLHRHTVRSHIERARELTGLDPRSLDGALQLRLALLFDAPDAPTARS